jgi:hypothetical protein
MTVGYGGRITRKGHWLDVIFISNEDSKENKKRLVNRFKTHNWDFLFSIEDDDEDKCLSVEGRSIHLTNNMSEGGKEYNRRIKSNTKIYCFPYEHASYMHSTSISEDYLILIEIPLHFNTFNATWNSFWFFRIKFQLFSVFPVSFSAFWTVEGSSTFYVLYLTW